MGLWDIQMCLLIRTRLSEQWKVVFMISPVVFMISPAHDIFISGQVWNNIRISKPTWSVPNILSHRTALPRHSLTSWLFVLNRNPTLDRLHSWGYDIGKTCILCGLHEETRNYLFLDCHYSLYIWKDLMVKLGIFNAPHSWPTLIQWLISNSGSTTLKVAIFQA